MKTRIVLAAMLYPMANAVLFGSAATLVMAVPFLAERAGWALPAAVAFALIGALPVSYLIAPRLRLRYWRSRRRRPARGLDAVVDELAK